MTDIAATIIKDCFSETNKQNKQLAKFTNRGNILCENFLSPQSKNILSPQIFLFPKCLCEIDCRQSYDMLRHSFLNAHWSIHVTSLALVEFFKTLGLHSKNNIGD